MVLKEITLLSEEEYAKYKSIISNAGWYWWLKTLDSHYDDGIRVVDDDGSLSFGNRDDCVGGVRPLCIFNLESSNPMFWRKPKTLVGSKIKCGKFEWTVLNAEAGELYALCDEIIAKHRFDSKTNVWEDSELKAWLESEGLSLITE